MSVAKVMCVDKMRLYCFCGARLIGAEAREHFFYFIKRLTRQLISAGRRQLIHKLGGRCGVGHEINEAF